ncbi:MGMT family protein [Cellulomonas sp. ATA003]|uniref:MGMT family protein n=1 Tax=Cellulomonas sp. ATA003 TaxID=3073064 RepID=UPI002872DF86|nr:MGMT family protein [Cellulomonas sp. ATA003]WNB86751.1 MGMT family protein [Cellulomonas sp. ATA003]
MDEDYLEAVLDLVDAVPPGRVMTYGTVADVVADAFAAAEGRPRGGPRQVGAVLSRAGSGVPWWRVVNAAGRPPAAHATRALAAWRAESTPLTADGARVDLRRALWWPDDAPEAASAVGPDDVAAGPDDGPATAPDAS